MSADLLFSSLDVSIDFNNRFALSPTTVESGSFYGPLGSTVKTTPSTSRRVGWKLKRTEKRVLTGGRKKSAPDSGEHPARKGVCRSVWSVFSRRKSVKKESNISEASRKLSVLLPRTRSQSAIAVSATGSNLVGSDPRPSVISRSGDSGGPPAFSNECDMPAALEFRHLDQLDQLDHLDHLDHLDQTRGILNDGQNRPVANGPGAGDQLSMHPEELCAATTREYGRGVQSVENGAGCSKTDDAAALSSHAPSKESAGLYDDNPCDISESITIGDAAGYLATSNRSNGNGSIAHYACLNDDGGIGLELTCSNIGPEANAAIKHREREIATYWASNEDVMGNTHRDNYVRLPAESDYSFPRIQNFTADITAAGNVAAVRFSSDGHAASGVLGQLENAYLRSNRPETSDVEPAFYAQGRAGSEGEDSKRGGRLSTTANPCVYLGDGGMASPIEETHEGYYAADDGFELDISEHSDASGTEIAGKQRGAGPETTSRQSCAVNMVSTADWGKADGGQIFPLVANKAEKVVVCQAVVQPPSVHEDNVAQSEEKLRWSTIAIVGSPDLRPKRESVRSVSQPFRHLYSAGTETSGSSELQIAHVPPPSLSEGSSGFGAPSPVASIVFPRTESLGPRHMVTINSESRSHASSPHFEDVAARSSNELKPLIRDDLDYKPGEQPKRQKNPSTHLENADCLPGQCPPSRHTSSHPLRNQKMPPAVAVPIHVSSEPRREALSLRREFRQQPLMAMEPPPRSAGIPAPSRYPVQNWRHDSHRHHSSTIAVADVRVHDRREYVPRIGNS